MMTSKPSWVRHRNRAPSQWTILATATLLMLGSGEAVQAADEAVVSLTPLHTFTGISGRIGAGNSAEVHGQGKNPHAPPVYDATSGRLLGGTQLGGSQGDTGIVYTLPAASAGAGFVSTNTSNGNAHTRMSPLIVAGPDGSYFQGATNLVMQFKFEDGTAALTRNTIEIQARIQAALDALGDSGRAQGYGEGLWAFGAVGGLPASLYFYRLELGDTLARTLWRYDPATDVVHRVHHWASIGKVDSMIGLRSVPGALPTSVILDADGQWLYGVVNTQYPLAATSPTNVESPEPFVFRVKPDGSDYERILSFTAAAGLGYPSASTAIAAYSGLLDGGDGWLYGTTYSKTLIDRTVVFPVPSDIPPDGNGSVYRVSKTEKDAATGAHKVEKLHTFAGGQADGAAAFGPIVKAADGNLYGTTYQGGEHGEGTLWRVVLADAGNAAKNNGFELLHSFSGAVDGKGAVGLSLGDDGWTLYGAAREGGVLAADVPAQASPSGTVFKVDITRPPVLLNHFTVDGQADSVKIEPGSKVNLAWESTNATVCTAGGDWTWSDPAKPATGSEESPALSYVEDGYTLTLACADVLDRQSETKTVRVLVNKPADEQGNGDGGSDGGNDGSSGGGGGPLAPALLLLLLPVMGLRLHRRG